jgi:DNA-binding NtrC family response regulator
VSPRPRSSVARPDGPAPILVISPYGEDYIHLPEILNDPHWEWYEAQGCAQALNLLNIREIGVVICELDQPDGSWRDLLEGAVNMAAPPNLIVCSRLADERLWAEVLNLGGYDVLAKPFDREEVLRVVFLAWDWWERRFGRNAVSKLPTAPNAPLPHKLPNVA